MGKYKTQILIFALLAGPFFIFFYPILFQGKIFSHAFNLFIEYPAYTFLAKSIQSGHSFMWVPHYLSGFPIAYEQFGFLNPLFLPLFKFIEGILVYHILKTVIFILGSLSTYWFARVLKLSKLAAIFVALGFMTSHWVVRWASIQSLEMLYPILPLLFLSVTKVFRGQNRYIILGIAVVFIGWLGGLTQVFFYTIISVCMFVVFLLFKEKENRRRNLVKFLLILIVGTLLASFWLLPTINLTLFSNRSQGHLPLGESLGTGVSFWDLPVLFNPYFNLPMMNQDSYIYLSPIILLLGVLAFFIVRKQKYANFFMFFFVFAFVSSLSWSPLFWATLYLPIFNLFRGPTHWLLFSNFSIALLAGYAIDYIPQHIATNKVRIYTKVATVFAAVVSAIVVAINLIFHFGHQKILNLVFAYFKKNLFSLTTGKSDAHYLGLINDMLNKVIKPISFGNIMFWFVFIFFIGSVVLFILFRQNRISYKIFAWSAILIVILNFLLVFHGFFNLIPRSLLDTEPATARFLKKDNSDFRMFRFYPGVAEYTQLGLDYDDVYQVAEMNRETLTQNINIVYGINSISGAENFMPRRQARLLNLLGFEDIQYGNDIWIKSKISISEKLKRFTMPVNLALMSMMNTKYILSPFKLPSPLKAVYEEKMTSAQIPLYIYENPNYLPQIYFAKNLKVVSAGLGEEDLFNKLLEIEDFKNMTMIECEACSGSGSLTAGRNDKVTIINESAGHLELRTKTSFPRYLVFSQSYLPTWEAKINGVRVRILSANYIYQAILVPAGDNEISFDYPGPFEQFKQSLLDLSGRALFSWE